MRRLFGLSLLIVLICINTYAINISNVSQTFPLAEAVWDDLRVPAQNTRVTPAKSEPAFEELTDGLFVYKFDASNADDESVHFAVQIPHGHKKGTNLKPHIHWCPDTGGTGVVRYKFDYIIADIGSTFNATAISSTITANATGVTFNHIMSNFAEIDMSNIDVVSAMLICRVTRMSTSDALDTYAGNACFLEFDFHYQLDRLGDTNGY